MCRKLLALFAMKNPYDNKMLKHMLALRINIVWLLVYFIGMTVIVSSSGAPMELGLAFCGIAVSILFFGLTYTAYYMVVAQLLYVTISVTSAIMAFEYGLACGAMAFVFTQFLIIYAISILTFRSRVILDMIIAGFYIAIYFMVISIGPLAEKPVAVLNQMQFLHYIIVGLQMTNCLAVLNKDNTMWEREMLARNSRLKEEADTDSLTGLRNRAATTAFMLQAAEDFVNKNSDAMTVVLADIDLFKAVNDTYGHNCGDMVLKQLAAGMKNYMKDKGCAGRWGGEEFLLVFEKMNGDDVKSSLYDLSKKVKNMSFYWDEVRFSISMTFGVAEYDGDPDLTKLVEAADEKLYIGKQNGRDCIIF